MRWSRWRRLDEEHRASSLGDGVAQTSQSKKKIAEAMQTKAESRRDGLIRFVSPRTPGHRRPASAIDYIFLSFVCSQYQYRMLRFSTGGTDTGAGVGAGSGAL